MPRARGQHDTDTLAGWLPVRLELTDAEPAVHWLRCAGELDDSPPKFAGAVAKLRESGVARRVTPLSAIASADLDRLAPTGFVFHLTRCGSTFVSNVLSALPDAVVIKEAEPIDACLRADVAIPDASRSAWLVDVLAALGQRFAGHERRYYVKFRSWNVLRHELIRARFPDVPCVFFYRDPIEVLVSLLRAEPPWTVEVVPGVTQVGPSKVEYYARVLAGFLERGLELADAGVPVVNFTELRSGRLVEVLGELGVPDTPELRALIDHHGRVHSKDPSRAFVSDTAAKRSAASPEMHAAIDRWARGLYDALEAKRAGA